MFIILRRHAMINSMETAEFLCSNCNDERAENRTMRQPLPDFKLTAPSSKL